MIEIGIRNEGEVSAPLSPLAAFQMFLGFCSDTEVTRKVVILIRDLKKFRKPQFPGFSFQSRQPRQSRQSDSKLELGSSEKEP